MNQNELITTRACLVGHTGFVGGHLAHQAAFSARFNTANISTIGEQNFDMIVCAATPGSMFEANKFPMRDQENIQALIYELSKAQTKRFIMISSIAVLQDFAGGELEDTKKFQEDHAYGRHRRDLEAFVEERFEESLIVRLPALFGRGLRKNFIFDLLNPVPTMLAKAIMEDLSAVLERKLVDKLRGFYATEPKTNMLKLDRTALNADPARATLDEALVANGFSATQFHNPETTYQYYDMNRLWSDIDIALQAGLRQIHLVTEPLKTARIHRRLIGRNMPDTVARLHREDMRTRNAHLWGKDGYYLDDADAVLEKLAAFFEAERQVE